MAHHHPAGSHAARHKRRLQAVLGLTGAFLLVELGAAAWSGSLSIAADAVHMMGDTAGVLLSLVAIWFAVAGFVLVEAWRRLLEPPQVASGLMLAVAIVGVIANGGSLLLLGNAQRESMNVRGAYLEVMGDALSSAAVILAGAVIVLTGWTFADPLAAAAIGILILPRTVGLLAQAVHVLLEGVPVHLDVAEIEAAMAEADGVLRVHDLHVWTLTSGREAMSAHVVVEPGTPGDRVLQDLHVILHARFGIDHTTIQIETEVPALVQITPAARQS